MKEKITKDMRIKEVVEKYPKTLEVFAKYEFHCIGCPAASFETIEDGAKAHGVTVEELIEDLNKSIKDT